MLVQLGKSPHACILQGITNQYSATSKLFCEWRHRNSTARTITYLKLYRVEWSLDVPLRGNDVNTSRQVICSWRLCHGRDQRDETATVEEMGTPNTLRATPIATYASRRRVWPVLFLFTPGLSTLPNLGVAYLSLSDSESTGCYRVGDLGMTTRMPIFL